MEDVHWAVQHDLAKQLPLDHVGRVERLDETLGAPRRARRPRRRVGDPARESHALPLPSFAYDGAERTRSSRPLSRRLRALRLRRGARLDGRTRRAGVARGGRSAPPGSPRHHREARPDRSASPRSRAGPNLERRLENRVEATRARRKRRSSRTSKTTRASTSSGGGRKGRRHRGSRQSSARRTRPSPPLGPAFSFPRWSGSSSSTTARRTAPPRSPAAWPRRCERPDRLEVHSYPFSIARCGEEHLGTPAESVHSLVYFYNWSFSHVRTGYVLKWDADMVLPTRPCECSGTSRGSSRPTRWS